MPETTKRYLHINVCTTESDNLQRKIYKPIDGAYMRCKNHVGGVGSHALPVAKDIDRNDVTARHKGGGQITFELENCDPLAKTQIQKWQAQTQPLLFSYRTWDPNSDGQFEPKETLAIWGEIIRHKLPREGAGSITILVHTVTVGDKTDESQDVYSIDCFNGEAGGDIGDRTPHTCEIPFTTAKGENFLDSFEV